VLPTHGSSPAVRLFRSFVEAVARGLEGEGVCRPVLACAARCVGLRGEAVVGGGRVPLVGVHGRSGLSTVATFVPMLLLFLVILIVGIFIAKAVAKALSAILERVGFDRAVERGGVKKALANSKYDASDVVAKIIYYALLLFVLQLAFGVFAANPISVLLAGIIAFLPKLIVAIIIVVVASLSPPRCAS